MIAGVKDGDKITAVNGESVKDWDQLRKAISAHPGEEIDLALETCAAQELVTSK